MAGAERDAKKSGNKDTDIETVMKILDSFAESGESRMKLEVDPALQAGSITKVHHHRRCDIGSPWATGHCFDADVCDG